MQRLVLFSALCCLSVAFSVSHAQQTAGEVYQWKDAKGVTHYSQTPPASGRYQQRVITRGQIASPVVTATSTAAAENPQCTSAKHNIAAFDSGAPVAQDTNGDGKADTTMNDEQRAAQRALAEAAVKAYCIT